MKVAGPGRTVPRGSVSNRSGLKGLVLVDLDALLLLGVDVQRLVDGEKAAFYPVANADVTSYHSYDRAGVFFAAPGEDTPSENQATAKLVLQDPGSTEWY